MSRQSPLVEVSTNNAIVHLPSISIAEKPFCSQYILRGLIDDSAFTDAVKTVLGLELPGLANTIVESEGLTVCWMSPDQWLLLTADAGHSNKLAVLFGALQDVFASINDVSSGQTIINIKGEKATEVLNKGTTVDVHTSVFKPGQCAQTVYAKSNVLIYPVCLEPHCEYDLIVRRSFADFLCRWLINACVEYKY
jgi:sarcosine oxidase subunit gamma